MDDLLLWIALRGSPGLRRSEANSLLERFGEPAQVFRQPLAELGRLCRPLAARALVRGPDLTTARAELERARHAGLRALVRGAPGFPTLLAEIPDPPLLLYQRGELLLRPSVAIVGSRRATVRGRESARQLAHGVAAAGGVVVSGLAYGIDAAAHAGALEAGGATVAVLASGLDRPSPAGNRALARRILARGGAWLSEHGPGVAPLARHFPERNRLISGLARATLIVEAREASGSLWTARHALDQGREVLVVPGPIDTESCRGSNRLLREGAAPVLELDDLLDAVVPGARRGAPSPAPEPEASGDAARVLARLRESPADADALCRELGLAPAALAPVLLELELRERIAREGNRICARPPGRRRR